MGCKFVDLAVFSHFWSNIYLQKLPAVPGAILRGPKNRFLGFPATKKVLERLLKCPKTTHKHYGTLPWGPWSTMGPSKANFANFTLFQQNLPHKTAQSAAGPSCGDPKTGLRGSLHAKKCWEAFYTVPRHHTITMGPYRGVPRAPWIRQKPTWKKITVFQPNLPHQTRAPARTAVFCDPKTCLRGSLRANKRSDAAYSAPRHHTISMGPHLGVPGAPWVRQNQKNRGFHPFPGP